MNEIRLGFHDILNKLNDITLRAGLVIETYGVDDYDSLGSEDAREKCKQAFDALEATEKAALDAGRDVENLMKKIYAKYSIDNAEPL